MHLNNAKAFGHAIQKALKDSNKALWKEYGNEKSLWEYEGRFNITNKGIQVYYGAAMFEMNESVFIKFSDIKQIVKKGSFLNKYI